MEKSIRLSGVVVEGKKIGRKMKSPTINLAGVFKIPFGVYVCKVETSKGDFAGAMHYGPRLTLKEKDPVLEVRLIDFEGDLYGETVNIEVYDKIREVTAFDNMESLRRRIEEDIKYIKENHAEIFKK